MKSWRGLKPCGPGLCPLTAAFLPFPQGALHQMRQRTPGPPDSHKDTHAGYHQPRHPCHRGSALFSTVEVKRYWQRWMIQFSNPHASSWKSTTFSHVPCPPTWPESLAWWGCWNRSSSAAQLSWWRQRVWNWTQPGSLWWAGRAAKRKGKHTQLQEGKAVLSYHGVRNLSGCTGLGPQRPRLLHSSTLRQFVFSFHHFPSKLSWKCAFNWKVILFAHKFWTQW